MFDINRSNRKVSARKRLLTLLMHWGCIFLAQTHWNVSGWQPIQSHRSRWFRAPWLWEAMLCPSLSMCILIGLHWWRLCFCGPNYYIETQHRINGRHRPEIGVVVHGTKNFIKSSKCGISLQNVINLLHMQFIFSLMPCNIFLTFNCC